jgi:hypothetical protein
MQIFKDQWLHPARQGWWEWDLNLLMQLPLPFVVDVLWEQNMVARLARKFLDDDVNALNLGKIVSAKDADWHSTGSVNVYKGLAEKYICRTLHLSGHLYQAQYAWLGSLCTNRMLLRKKGTWTWKLVVGVMFDIIVATLRIDYSNGVDP